MAQDTFVSMAGAYDKSPCSAIEGKPKPVGGKTGAKKTKNQRPNGWKSQEFVGKKRKYDN